MSNDAPLINHSLPNGGGTVPGRFQAGRLWILCQAGKQET